MNERIVSYRAFWPYYLREHAQPRTRGIHLFGTGLVLLCALAGFVMGRWEFFVLMPIAGYGPAWIAHFFVEKNRPATFRYPLWSLLSDFRMFFMWIIGALPQELRRAGIGS